MEDYLVRSNPDEEIRKLIIRKIHANDGYCLSQPKSENTKCKCEYFRRTHDCLCGLFIKVPVLEVT